MNKSMLQHRGGRKPVHILVLSPYLIGNSSVTGGDVSTLGFLKSFAHDYKLHIVALDEVLDRDEAASARKDMEEWAASVQIVPNPMSVAIRIKAKLAQMVFFPNAATRTSSEAFRDAFHDVLARYTIDLVIILHSQMAHYIVDCKGIPTIMAVEDAYSVSGFRDFAASKQLSLLKKYRAARNWLSWVCYERRYYRQFDHLFVVSEQDSYGLRIFSPNLKTTVLPRIVSLPRGISNSIVPCFHIGFIGSFTHKPNSVAVGFLFDKVLPQLVNRVPDLRVLIAGKNPPGHLIATAPACVTFGGFMPSVSDFYDQIQIIVAPLITGGGIKIKVVEGLLSGRPLVTTSIGAEGTNLTDGVDFLLADDPPTFVDAILALIHSREAREAIGKAGQRYALDFTSLERHKKLVERVFQSVCGAA